MAGRSGVASGFLSVCSRGKLVVALPPLLVGLEEAAGVRPGLPTRSGGPECRVRDVLLGGPGSTLGRAAVGGFQEEEC